MITEISKYYIEGQGNPNTVIPDGLGRTPLMYMDYSVDPTVLYKFDPTLPSGSKWRNLDEIIHERFIPKYSIADIRATKLVDQVVIVVDDNKVGTFKYDPTDVVSADNEGIILVDDGGRRYKRQFEGLISVKWFGAVGDGVTNDTSFIQNAVNNSTDKCLHIPSGTYIVDTIGINSSVKLTGEYNTVIQQGPTSLSGTSLFYVLSSNVSVDNLTLKGLINTHTGEHNHGIILGNLTESFSKITLSNLTISDFRGDGIYITDNGINKIYNIDILNIEISNCIRQGITIISGDNINIDNCNIFNIGLEGIDVESDTINHNVNNLRVNNCKLSSIQLSPSYGNNFSISNLYIDRSTWGSTPPYNPSHITKGIYLTNSSNVLFNNIFIDGHDYSIIFGPSIVQPSNVIFNNMQVSNVTSILQSIVVENTNYDSEVVYNNCTFTRGSERYINSPNLSTFNNCKFINYPRCFEVTPQNVYNSVLSGGTIMFYYMSGNTTIKNSDLTCTTVFFGQDPLCTAFISENKLNVTNIALNFGTVYTFNNI